jgi:hypothetical protein
MLCPKGNFSRIFVTVGFACALSLHPAKLLADTVSWAIADNTSFAGGGELSGSFQYDAPDNIYSDVHVIAGDDEGTLDPVFVPGDTYTTSDVTADSNASELDLLDSGTGTEVQLYFLGGLSDAGGAESTGLHLVTDGETVDYEAPGNISFNASVAPAPEPGTTLLMVFGVAAVFAAKKFA